MVLALTWLCVRGTEMSAKFQRIMVGLDAWESVEDGVARAALGPAGPGA